MPLFGSSGAPKFQLTRRMIIVLAVFGVVLVSIIILAVVLSVNSNQAKQRAKVAAVPTATMAVAEATLPPAADTALPASTQGVAEATSVPVPPTQPVAVVPTVMATAIPAPTVQTGGGGGVAPTPAAGGGVASTPPTGGGVASTTPAAGGGESAALPASSSGLPYLIPVGAVLLAAIVWWRWRRARAHGS